MQPVQSKMAQNPAHPYLVGKSGTENAELDVHP